MTFSHPQYSLYQTAPYEDTELNKNVRRTVVGGAAPVQDESLLTPPDEYDSFYAKDFSIAKSLTKIIGSQDTIAATSDPGCVNAPKFYRYKLDFPIYYVDSVTDERVEPDYEWSATTGNPALIDVLGGSDINEQSVLLNWVQNGPDPLDPDKICQDPPASQCCNQIITGNTVSCLISYTDSGGVSDSFVVTLDNITSTQFGNRT